MKHLSMTKIAAIGLIAVAFLLAFYALALSRRPVPAAPVAKAVVSAPTYPVVVAAHPLPPGAAITRDDLRVVMLPMLPSSAFSDTSLAVGRVPLQEIGANVPIVEAQLSSGFAEQVAPGERAVAIHVDEASSVGDRVRPGNYVDVFITLKRDAGTGPDAEIARSQTRLLLSRVRVLAFGNTVSGAGNPSQFGSGAHTAVLAVPTADVDRLALADSAGHVLLALRNPRDPGVIAPFLSASQQGVVPASGRLSSGSDDLPSTQAAAGVSLRELAGGVAPARPPVRSHIARTYAGPAPGIEVIRAGRTQTLSD